MMIEHSIDISALLAASHSLDEALNRASHVPSDDMLRDACIQRFEYCYELAWKTMKRILNYRGLDVNSPRPVFRQAAKEGLIADPEIWFEFLEKWNAILEDYGIALLEDVPAILPLFQQSLHDFMQVISVKDVIARPLGRGNPGENLALH